MDILEDLFDPENLFSPDGGGKLDTFEQALGQSILFGVFDECCNNNNDDEFHSSSENDFEDTFEDDSESFVDCDDTDDI